MIRFAVPEDFPALTALMSDNGLCVDGISYAVFSQPCLVMVREGVVVGFIQALLGSPYAVITELAIAREHQRKGYAVTLLEHMETVMRSAGVVQWATFTGKKNDAVADQLSRIGALVTGEGLGFVKRMA